MIAIIAGCGANISSVQFALQRLGHESILTTDELCINQASHVILPGVGTAQHAMKQLYSLQLVDVIRTLKQPLLGICLGMQLLYDFSQEGNVECLGIVAGEVSLLTPHEGLARVHMGWNQVEIVQQQSPLFHNIADESYVYYVHSYAAAINHTTIATTQYGQSFAAMVAHNNFYGVQFHPERSGLVGEQILKNFLEIGVSDESTASY